MTLNFDLWNNLLQEYVNDLGQVNYQCWQSENQTTLTEWLTQQSQLNLVNLDHNQRLALWINLYNALTIAQVLARYPIDSIFPKILGIPNFIAFLWFFQRPLWSNKGQRYSLNRIEHRLLRPQFKDPRLHFALVCASVGCPLLRPEAYLPERVQHQLSEDASRFINNPAKVRYESRENCLYLSPIFRWYRQDFQNATPCILDYIQPYLDSPSQLPPSVSIRYFRYDWSLNQRISG